MDTSVEPLASYKRHDMTTLTPREHSVARLVTDGLSNKLIADRLGISDHTAKFHVSNIIMKLGAETRTHAAVMYMAAHAFATADHRACPNCGTNVPV